MECVRKEKESGKGSIVLIASNIIYKDTQTHTLSLSPTLVVGVQYSIDRRYTMAS